MKKLLNELRNWRYIVFNAIGIIAILLLLVECDDLLLFTASKVSAIVLVLIAAALWRTWENEGSVTIVKE